MVRHDSNGAWFQRLTVIIDGKRYKRESLGMPNTLLMLGNYRAKIARNSHGAGEYESRRVNEILFFDISTSHLCRCRIV
jgi:hypothetical protein